MAIVNATDANFAEVVDNPSGLVVVDFWSRTCGPCRMIAPVLKELAERHPEDLHLVMVGIEQALETSRRWQVRATPTLIALRDGEEQARHSGAIVRGQLVDWVESRL